MFVTRKIETSITSVNGAPFLAGILPAGDVYDGGTATDKGARLTFVIAQKAGSHTPKVFTAAERANLSPPIRVHTLGFRVPGETAALWLAEPAAGDAAWLDHALSLVREGKAALIHHAACGARSGQRCRANGFAEPSHFPNFTTLEDPLDTRYAGSLVEFEPVMSTDGRTLDVNIALEEAGRPREDQTAVSGQSARLKAPVFPVVRLQTSLTVGLGEVRLLGVAGASPDDALYGRAPGTTDVYFFKNASASPGTAPDAGSRGPGTPKLLRVIASLYSLNEQEAAAAQSALDDPDDRLQVAEEIESRWREESCPLLTQAALTTRSGAKVKLESGADRVLGVTFGAGRKPRAPLDPAVLADGPPLRSSDKNRPDTLHRTTGLTLTATPILDAGGRQATFLALECRYDAAPARWPTHMRLPPIPAGEENTPDAAFSAINYLETFTLDGEQTFTVGESCLAGVQPSRAPSGPEAGRWHARVVRVDVVE